MEETGKQASSKEAVLVRRVIVLFEHTDGTWDGSDHAQIGTGKNVRPATLEKRDLESTLQWIRERFELSGAISAE